MKLGHVLKLIRTNKRMTQKEMADTLGISQNYLSLIESDKKTPSSEKLSRFANSLKISKDAFIFLSSEPPAELNNKNKKDYIRLQQNILSLLLFEITGEIRQVA